MSLLSKGDFRTKEEWLKKQRKELMKRQSQKYHQFNTTPSNRKPIREQDTLAHLLSPHIHTPPDLKQTHPSTSSIAIKGQADAQLHKEMSVLLHQRQQQMLQQRQIIENIQYQLQRLRTENALIRAMECRAIEMLQHKQSIQQQNNILTAKYAEMEQYLMSNGVTWQHNKLVGQLHIHTIKQQIKQHNCHTPSQQQLQTILQRIAELNQSLRNQLGSSQYVNQDGVFRLQKVPQVVLTFYRDGVCLGSIFCAYESRQAVRCLDDLQQGYYPYLFKGQYPNGVMMSVVGELDKFYPVGCSNATGLMDQWFIGKHHSLHDE